MLQMLPLQLTQLYAAQSFPNRYWHFPKNATEWSVFMTELTLSGNAISKLMLQALAPTLRDSHIGASGPGALAPSRLLTTRQRCSTPTRSSQTCSSTRRST